MPLFPCSESNLDDFESLAFRWLGWEPLVKIMSIENSVASARSFLCRGNRIQIMTIFPIDVYTANDMSGAAFECTKDKKCTRSGKCWTADLCQWTATLTVTGHQVRMSEWKCCWLTQRTKLARDGIRLGSIGLEPRMQANSTRSLWQLAPHIQRLFKKQNQFFVDIC